MNFNCVGRNSKGLRYMKYNQPFSILEQIQLLQRWILTQSFSYYELNENIASDFDYDANAMQLVEMMRQYPEEASRSRYWDYFYDYADGGDLHYTSGFDLLERVKKEDKALYRRIWMDAALALDMKSKMKGEYNG